MKIITPAVAILVAALATPLRSTAADSAPGRAATRPNLIFVLSDDVGIGNISCYGGHFKTPNIDALAQGGTRFEYSQDTTDLDAAKKKRREMKKGKV